MSNVEILHYLVVFDNREQRIIRRQRFSDPDRAATEYVRWERQYRDRPYEVVLLGADSIETMKNTHRRYFGGATGIRGSIRHVVPVRDKGWAVKREEAGKSSKLFRTQADAISHAREIARDRGGQIIVHRRDGRIRESWSYESVDPFPPHDEKD